MPNSLTQLTIKNQTYQLPIYLPDATLGVVRGLDTATLKQTGIEGVVINTYHLKDHPGVEVLKKTGGIKNFMNFEGLTASDSGGFQLFSLINKNPDLGKITDEGVVLYTGPKKQKKVLFTPEDSVKIQFEINSDIMICLDDFTPDQADEKRLQESVDRTIAWAKRCKAEFQRQIKKRGLTDETRPLLLAPIQGHRNWDLRRYCAQELLKLDFDGYGLGGWPFDDQGNFDYEMCQINASLTPDDKLRFALGIGTPANITALYQMGYHIFDCVLPTRDARHQRLYVYKQDISQLSLAELNAEGKKTATKNAEDKTEQPGQTPAWYDYLYLNKAKYAQDLSPVAEKCDCFTCQNYSKAYLHHLFKVKEILAYRLASIHNLHFYAQLMKRLRMENSQDS